MSMSTSVIGIVPPDEKWKKMKAVYTACMKAEIEPPQEVIDHFDGGEPDEMGMEVDVPVEERTDCDQMVYVVEMAKVPAKVKFLKFINSW